MMNNVEDDERVVLKEETGSCTTVDEQQGATFGYSRARLWVLHLLGTYKYQVAVVSLVIFNCILLIVQLMLEHQPREAETDRFARFNVLDTVNLALLSLFSAEVCVKAYAFATSYLRRKFEVFDALVVLVTFPLYLTLHEAFGLVVAFRLWRVVKILNGVVRSVKAPLERALDRERRVNKGLEDEATELRDRCARLKERSVACEGLLVRHGIPCSEPPKADPD